MESLENVGFDRSNFKDYVEISEYMTEEITPKETLGKVAEKVLTDFPALEVNSPENVLKLSDYNKI